MKTYTISGTEIGALLGLNPYMTPMDLYMRKQGLIDPPPENEAMKWGSAAEHVVARRYAREHPDYKLGPSVDVGYDYQDPLHHPDYSWWTGTPDRRIQNADDNTTTSGLLLGLLEIKIVGERTAHLWGDPPAGDVPEFYLTQCAWYMPLLDVEWADLAVQIGNRDYRVYRINRDRELENQLRDAALAFIKDHLIPEVPPAIDGSESSRRYLNYRYPKDQGPMVEPTDEDVLVEVGRLQIAKKELKDWQEVESTCTNRLKAVIGDATGLKGEWGKIYWKKNKDSRETNWEGLAMSLNPSPDDLERFTTTKPGARVFRPYFAKED